MLRPLFFFSLALLLLLCSLVPETTAGSGGGKKRKDESHLPRSQHSTESSRAHARTPPEDNVCDNTRLRNPLLATPWRLPATPRPDPTRAVQRQRVARRPALNLPTIDGSPAMQSNANAHQSPQQSPHQQQQPGNGQGDEERDAADPPIDANGGEVEGGAGGGLNGNVELDINDEFNLSFGLGNNGNNENMNVSAIGHGDDNAEVIEDDDPPGVEDNNVDPNLNNDEHVVVPAVAAGGINAGLPLDDTQIDDGGLQPVPPLDVLGNVAAVENEPVRVPGDEGNQPIDPVAALGGNEQVQQPAVRIEVGEGGGEGVDAAAAFRVLLQAIMARNRVQPRAALGMARGAGEVVPPEGLQDPLIELEDEVPAAVEVERVQPQEEEVEVREDAHEVDELQRNDLAVQRLADRRERERLRDARNDERDLNEARIRRRSAPQLEWRPDGGHGVAQLNADPEYRSPRRVQGAGHHQGLRPHNQVGLGQGHQGGHGAGHQGGWHPFGQHDGQRVPNVIRVLGALPTQIQNLQSVNFEMRQIIGRLVNRTPTNQEAGQFRRLLQLRGFLEVGSQHDATEIVDESFIRGVMMLSRNPTLEILEMFRTTFIPNTIAAWSVPEGEDGVRHLAIRFASHRVAITAARNGGIATPAGWIPLSFPPRNRPYDDISAHSHPFTNYSFVIRLLDSALLSFFERIYLTLFDAVSYLPDLSGANAQVFFGTAADLVRAALLTHRVHMRGFECNVAPR